MQSHGSNGNEPTVDGLVKFDQKLKKVGLKMKYKTYNEKIILVLTELYLLSWRPRASL